MLGLAWPSIPTEFGVPLDGLGLQLLVGVAGALTTSFASGWTVRRLGIGRLLALSAFLSAAGLAGLALAPSWAAMVAVVLVGGLGAGAIDAGLNAHAALHFSPRLLNWLHAAYGLGAALGPLVMAAVFDRDQSWRLGYLLVAAVAAALGLAFLLTARRWEDAPSQAGPAPAAATGRPIPPIPPLPLGLSLALFFVYAGVEATAGQWSFTLFTEARGVSAVVAGLWVSAYWSCFTGGRVLFGVVASRLLAAVLVRTSLLAMLASATVMWLSPGAAGLVALAVLGFAAAPVYPALIGATPGRLGERSARNAISFQVGVGAVGLAALPGLGGFLAERLGLAVLGPFLVLACLLLVARHEALLRAVHK